MREPRRDPRFSRLARPSPPTPRAVLNPFYRDLALEHRVHGLDDDPILLRRARPPAGTLAHARGSLPKRCRAIL